ncbi:hypothetical protein [Streptomyces sp. NPDC056626]|uniref:hypothetical protein n=1 Tax=unclassified Streptomyces TaxID=2593676 RepID=UPI00093FBF16|nr:hypothetical protein [Streptomyces sp. CB01883]OKJ80744.1 hypothetical protein AMK32_23565 [Streptomyces sp. CB01883]
MPSHRRTGLLSVHVRPRSLASITLTCCCLVAAGALTGCGNGGGGTGSTASATPTAPDTASFSGAPPSALASSASSAIASARESASAAASSASARAEEFEASVSAEFERRTQAAQNALKGVKGSGNAVSDVGMTGIPKAQTGGVLAVLVTITNKTSQKASYAVQIDFEDADHHVVETRYTGAENLEPGKKEQPIVFSHQQSEQNLTPRLAKAQRY